MKLPTKRSHKKLWIAGILSLVIVAGASIGVYAMQMNNKKDDPEKTTSTPRSNPAVDDRSVSYDDPAKDEIKAGEDIKKQSVDPETPASSTPGNVDSELTTSANFADGTLTVRSMISSSVSGTCTLTLTKGSSTITKEPVGIQALSNYSSCKGWSIPASELSSGSWSVKVTASYASKTANSTTTVAIP